MAKGGSQQTLCTVTFVIGVVKKFGVDSPCFIADIGAGVGDTVEKCIAGIDLVIENPIGSDDRRVDIGQYREGNALFLAELSQRRLIVIGNDVEFDPVFPEFRVSIAQLAELRPAGWSPDNRADKNNNRPRLFAIGI